MDRREVERDTELERGRGAGRINSPVRRPDSLPITSTPATRFKLDYIHSKVGDVGSADIVLLRFGFNP